MISCDDMGYRLVQGDVKGMKTNSLDFKINNNYLEG